MNGSESDSPPSLALLLRYEHPERAGNERKGKQRSIDGIRQIHNHQRHLHAVALSLERLCDCVGDEEGGEYSDNRHACSCFGDEDRRSTSLYLSKNNLTVERLAPLAAFRGLEVLSLADNVIEHVPEVLRGMPGLKRLSLSSNPVMARPHVWEQILAFRPSLKELNGRRVSEQDVRRACNVYKEECILRNLGYLLELLQGGLPGDLWVQVVDRVEQVLVGGLSSLPQLAEEYFLFDEGATFKLSDEAIHRGRSHNHRLALALNRSWVNSATFSMSDNVNDECVESVLLDVTSSLVSLESLCRKEEEGVRVDDVHELAMTVWRAVFSYRDAERNRKEMAAAVAKLQEAEEVERANLVAEQEDVEREVRREMETQARLEQERAALDQELRTHREQIDILRAQRDDSIQLNASMAQQVELLQKQLQDQESVKLELEGENAGMKQVMSMISDQLEASKRNVDTLMARNQLLVKELDVANQARSTAARALGEAEAALAEARRTSMAELDAQKASFMEAIECMRLDLDAARLEGGVRLNIEVVNPDVTRQVTDRDATISRMATEMEGMRKECETRSRDAESRHREDIMDASALEYRRAKAQERMALVAGFCFRNWIDHVRRRRSLHRLAATMSKVEMERCHGLASSVMKHWRQHSNRSRIAAALREVQQAKASARMLGLVVRGWHTWTLHRARVEDFIQKRSSNMARRALEGFVVHTTNQRERRTRIELDADDLAHTNRKRVAGKIFAAWHAETVAGNVERDAISSQIEWTRRACLARHALGVWMHGARAARHDRRNEMTSINTYHRNLMRSALRAFSSHARVARSRRELADKLLAERSHVAMAETFRVWRAWRLQQRETMRAVFGAWRSHHYTTLLSTKSGLQASLILAGTIADARAHLLKERLEATTASIERKDALTLKIAASLDSLQERFSESREAHRKTLSNMAQRQHRMVKERRALRKQLRAALSDTADHLGYRNELQQRCLQLEASVKRLEDTSRRVETENKHLQLRLRASDAVKSSAQIRAKKVDHMHATDHTDWSLGAGRTKTDH